MPDHGKSNSDRFTSMKTLSLNRLTAKQHLFMALCRDVSLLPPIIYLFKSLNQTYQTIYQQQITTDLYDFIGPRASEHLLCSIWCFVSLYLSYVILDSLMVRWIVKYSTVAAILRMFSMSLILVTFEYMLLASLSPNNDYFLHTWILISCVLTGAYIWQNYLTSDLNYKHFKDKFQWNKKKTIDLYNIIVFCVVPVGIASFITMLGLLRILFIGRLDIQQVATFIQSSSS
ncbi:hypothetical protein KAFR_0J00790 [Kazachstania africana CBS 2517]|uniref:N-glycosylation protein EOS1 n=1 Tax=Kazachstania africana (strain ATCC 22294 / BCRC 22015 / CBS 2517 / CECT 1963 / NBRC 1671 / NRRL Y-8276) TaxID=1071382 RepID=H2B0J7_KAZAF|nr:hypothetical protein KAFR_0J00790 [Kazachstania africana CBS 2517]CCF60147.1 hypothetical protein KAFR_0J00790 [Kazachstania africana CBS 2517]